MRDIKTREAFEFWDKLNALPRYAFLLSPSGKSVQKFEDQAMGNWIDVHEAQKVVDQAQDQISELRASYGALGELYAGTQKGFERMQAERDALQQRLNAADQRIDDQAGLLRRCVMAVREQHCDPDEAEFDLPAELMADIDAQLSASTESGQDDDWHMNPCKQGHRDVGASGGVAACNQCGEKIEAATTQEAFDQWNASHPPATETPDQPFTEQFLEDHLGKLSQ